jgi:phage terminase small subunit
MAGVKGRSGGPRKNTGGKRPGAGRKPKNPKPAAAPAVAAPPPVGSDAPAEPDAGARGQGVTDAKLFLEGVMSGRIIADETQLRAAQALLPFQHKKLGETGKKEQRNEEAKGIVSRFAPAPPRLAAVAGKKI